MILHFTERIHLRVHYPLGCYLTTEHLRASKLELDPPPGPHSPSADPPTSLSFMLWSYISQRGFIYAFIIHQDVISQENIQGHSGSNLLRHRGHTSPLFIHLDLFLTFHDLTFHRADPFTRSLSTRMLSHNGTLKGIQARTWSATGDTFP